MTSFFVAYHQFFNYYPASLNQFSNHVPNTLATVNLYRNLFDFMKFMVVKLEQSVKKIETKKNCIVIQLNTIFLSGFPSKVVFKHSSYKLMMFLMPLKKKFHAFFGLKKKTFPFCLPTNGEFRNLFEKVLTSFWCITIIECWSFPRNLYSGTW